MTPTAEVLNGTITVGDKVAIAVGAGRYGWGMRIGTVLGITHRSKFSGAGWDEVKVRVERSSGCYSMTKPYTKTFEYPRAMVKLNND